MPRREKLPPSSKAAAQETSGKEKEPSFTCFYRRDQGSTLLGRAEQGDVGAQFALGRLYFEGAPAESHNHYYGKDGKDLVASYIPAFERHLPLSAMWLRKAADQGHVEAQQLLEVVRFHVSDGVHCVAPEARDRLRNQSGCPPPVAVTSGQ